MQFICEITVDRFNSEVLIKILLICGIISSIIYFTVDLVAATVLYEGYDYTAQQQSELSAIGAPTRLLWLAMTIVYDSLIIAFSIGLWLAAGEKRSVRITSILLVIYSIIGIIFIFFPMNQPGTGAAESDFGHLIVVILQLITMFLFLSVGSSNSGKNFQIYSIFTIIAMLVSGVIVFTQVDAIAAGEKVQLLGLIERVSIFLPVLWILVLAYIYLRKQQEYSRYSSPIV